MKKGGWRLISEQSGLSLLREEVGTLHLSSMRFVRCVAVTMATATLSVTTETFGYSYDKAGNRQSEQRDTVMAGFTFNNLNQVLSRNGGGGILVRGNTDEPAQVTVNGKSVTPAADNTFETVVPGTNGANTIAVTAKDFSPAQNTQTKSWSATMSAGATATYTYDGNGNMTGDGSRAFQWDAKNRLTRIVYTGTNASTEMTYDGLDRRVSIVEKDGTGTVVSSKSFVWDGLTIADQRIGSTVSKQYFTEGWRDASAGTNYFYGRDHLGSVREVVNASSSVLTRYGYDAYGRGSKLSGTVDSDFQYTGHYAHSPSGLFLAPYRAYDAELGRWISRDPLGEGGGINLYGYVSNDPINWIDPLGLWTVGGRLNISGPGFDVSFGVTLDGHGNVDITTSAGPGLTGGLGATLGLTTTNAECVDTLHGWGNSAGFSGGEGLIIENNVVWGDGYVGGDFGLGIGAGAPITPQGARTKTNSLNR